MAEISILNGYKIKDKKAIRYYNSVNEMKADNSIKENMCISTNGYYEPNDGGGAIYKIVSDQNLINDNGYIIELNNGLFAKMIIINEQVNIRQLGAISDDPTIDSKAQVLIYLKILKDEQKKITLFIPCGNWFFSEVDLYNEYNAQEGVRIIGCNEAVYSNGTRICPFNNNQRYIFNLGREFESGTIVGNNVLKNLFFTTSSKEIKLCETALLLTCCCYSHFDNLMFFRFRGSAITIQTGFENYFGTLHLRGVGYVSKNKVYDGIVSKRNPTYSPGSAVSANYINYIDVEGIVGSVIYLQSGASHNEINNIQVEWTIDSNYMLYDTDNMTREVLTTSQDTIAWDDTSENIVHCFIVKGVCGANYEPLIINNISCSWASPKCIKYTYTDDNSNEVYKYLRYSGVLGEDENNVNNYGLNCIVSNIHARGENDTDKSIPAFYSIRDKNKFLGRNIMISNLSKTLVPFQIRNGNRDNLSCLSYKTITSESNPIVREDLSITKVLGTKDFLNIANYGVMYDKDSYNDDKLCFNGASWHFINLDGSNHGYKLRIKYTEYQSLDDLPSEGSWSTYILITFPDGTKKQKNLVIPYSEFHNHNLNLNEWVEIDINDWIPYGQCQLELRYAVIDCILESALKTSTASQLNSDIYKKSKVGAVAYCTDRRKTAESELGINLYFNGTTWVTFDGVTIENLVS